MASRPLPGLGSTRLRRMFSTYRSRAVDLVRDPQALDALARQARRQANRSTNSRIRELSEQIKRLGRLIRAYANGSYRDVSAGNIVLAVAAILYFVTPLDLVPDAIPGAGFVDDATVLAFVLSRLQLELEQFAAWERSQAITIE
ncbi:MAG: YkvA family protein [Acidimicrobiia bacterium]